MATTRFPKRKYLRQLRDMREDLWWWAASYGESAERTPVEWLQGRFLDRKAVLEDAMYQLQEAFDALDALPRLT